MSKKHRSSSKRHRNAPLRKQQQVSNQQKKIEIPLFDSNLSFESSLTEVPLQNSLGAAIGYPGCNPLVNFGQGYGGGNPNAPQISQMNGLFQDLKWYLISNFRQPLSQAYVEIALIQTMVDIPVDDALRGGIEIQSKQLSPEQIDQLQIAINRDKILSHVGQAAKWMRLFGGAGLLTLVSDQDPEEPLLLESITKDSELEFRAVDMWELLFDRQTDQDYDPSVQDTETEFYNYYGHNIHSSRVMKMVGLTAPSFIRPRLRGWGFSEVEKFLRSLNQYLKATNVVFATLDEFKVDVYKVKNLINTLMLPDGGQAIAERIRMANWQKNYQNALVMDSEDDWAQKQLTFSGIAETMAGIRMQVASDMRMPITKLFGTSASAGLGNTDQNDLENYNAMIESTVRNKIKYDLLRVVEILSQKEFQFIPDDLEIEFKPLRVLSAVDEENVKNAKFQRIIQMSQLNKIDDKTLLDICNKENLLGAQIDLEDLNLPSVGVPSSEDISSAGENDQKKKQPSPAEKVQPLLNHRRHLLQRTNDEKEVLSSSPPPAEAQSKEWPDVAVPDDSKHLDSYESQYDLMAYESEGGDDWISVQQMQFYSKPLDQKLWEATKEASMKYLKSENEKYRIWIYRRWGGKFSDIRYEANDDLMSYSYEGGDDWIDLRQMAYYDNPIDQELWNKAKEASDLYLKSDNLKYKIWWYRRHAGQFGDKHDLTNTQINK